MESVKFSYFDRAMPFFVKYFQVFNSAGKLIAENAKNHHSRVELTFPDSIKTDLLTIKLRSTHGSSAAVNGTFISEKI